MSNYGINELINRYPKLELCKDSIEKAFQLLMECYRSGHKLLVAGNGGSCADSEHIVGELMKGFKNPRKLSSDLVDKLNCIDSVRGENLSKHLQSPLEAIALDGHQGLNTAFINDIKDGGLYLYAQQMLGYGKKDDVFLAISTSGNSENILNATIVAKALGVKVIALTGKDGGKLVGYSDCAIIVPNDETFMIQEYHLPIYHCLCLMLEGEFYDEDKQ